MKSVQEKSTPDIAKRLKASMSDRSGEFGSHEAETDQRETLASIESQLDLWSL